MVLGLLGPGKVYVCVGAYIRFDVVFLGFIGLGRRLPESKVRRYGDRVELRARWGRKFPEAYKPQNLNPKLLWFRV